MIPGVQTFKYVANPITMIGSGNQPSVNTFTFPAVPTGLVWTGGFFICPSNAQSQSVNTGVAASGYGDLTYIVYRNGQPEATWNGYSVLENYQATGGDVITIIAYGELPTQGSTTVGTQMMWVGSSVDESNAQPAVPYLTNGTTPTPTGGSLEATATSRIAGSSTTVTATLLNDAGATLLNLVLSGWCSSNSGGPFRCIIAVTDLGNGNVLGQFTVITASASATAQQALSIPLYNYVCDGLIQLSITAGSGNLSASEATAVLMYSQA